MIPEGDAISVVNMIMILFKSVQTSCKCIHIKMIFYFKISIFFKGLGKCKLPIRWDGRTEQYQVRIKVIKLFVLPINFQVLSVMKRVMLMLVNNYGCSKIREIRSIISPGFLQFKTVLICANNTVNVNGGTTIQTYQDAG